MSQYFPKLYERSSGKAKIELDLSIYVTKLDVSTLVAPLKQ